MLQTLVGRGCEALAAGSFQEAVSLFREALAGNAGAPQVWSNLGIALFKSGERREALSCFQRAVDLAPDFAQGHYNLGHFLAQCGDLERGLASCRQAVALDGQDPGAHNNMGSILSGLGRHREALACFSRACELDPSFILAWNNRAGALKELGRLDQAAAGFRKVLQMAPGQPHALAGLSGVYQQRGEIERAVSLLREALALAPGDAAVHSNLIMALNYSHLATQQEIVDESKLWACLHGEQEPGEESQRQLLGRRIRIGYVSGDLHRHPVGTFLKEILKNHDKTTFQITCYYNASRSDRVTADLRAHAERWFNIVGMSDAEVCDLIRSNEIDILIDLSGHTGSNRLPLFALKPAPIQATWLGYWHSTGLSSIDYLITDPVTVPPGEEPYYSERLLRLPTCRFCYSPPAPSPFVDELPAGNNGFLTFGSFNNVVKLTPAVIALWARVLLAVPDSRLVLKWGGLDRAAVRNSFRARFAAHGVDPQRIECRGSSSPYLALAEYGDIDIALDPFPFNGGMTSCEALWMGVPVLTLAGEVPISRQTASFLKAIDLPEFICTDEEQFVARAVAVAGDLQGLARLREGLRERMERSTLCDGAAFTRDLQSLYRVMLQEKTDGTLAAQRATVRLQEEPATPLVPPVLPLAAAPRRRLRVAYLVPHQESAPPASPILERAAQHDRDELDVYLYLDRGADPKAPDAAGPAKVRMIGSLPDRLLSRLLLIDGIDVLVDLSAQEGGARRDPGLAASVPVYLCQDTVSSAAALEALYRGRWLAWFVAQRKPRRGRAHPAVAGILDEVRTLRIAGRLSDAEEKLLQALALDPGNADLLTVLGGVLVYQWRLEEGLACFRRALAFDPAHVKARSNLLFTLNYDESVTGSRMSAESRAWGRRHTPKKAAAPFANLPDPERPLRIGYLSGDMRRHSVSFFLEPLLAAHDRERVSVFCYSCVEHPDETTSRLKLHACGWRDCAGMSDGEIAALVREDGIDILVDLAGHTGTRILLPVLAQKPAPLQVSWLGYPNSTGLSSIDYRLTDALADPKGEERWYSEKLFRLPGGFLCYRPDPEAPEPGSTPARKNGFVTFGSFNMLPKVSPSTLAAWTTLLAQVPDSRLVLKCHPLCDGATRERVLRAFRSHGIDEGRIELREVLVTAAQHLALYNEIDIALDTFPYNGTTTTCEALWMGVPVVTLAGERHAARVGKSLLAQLGLDELVAADSEEYLRIASTLAAEPERLARYRSSLRDTMRRSPLCDEPGFAGKVESAYREMWRSWCRRQTSNEGRK